MREDDQSGIYIYIYIITDMYIYIHMTSLSHDDVFASSLVYHTMSVHRHHS